MVIKSLLKVLASGSSCSLGPQKGILFSSSAGGLEQHQRQIALQSANKAANAVETL